MHLCDTRVFITSGNKWTKNMCKTYEKIKLAHKASKTKIL
jgi:hypothetical protein